MAKKIFWGFMYLLAAALAVLAVYLYVIPEREIYVAEKIEGEKAPEWIDMPVYTVNGVRAEIGTAFLGGLLDSGLTLKYEVDGKMYDLDPKKAEAAPRTRYEMVLFHEALPVADLTYTNPSEKTCSLRKDILKCIRMRQSPEWTRGIIMFSAARTMALITAFIRRRSSFLQQATL